MCRATFQFGIFRIEGWYLRYHGTSKYKLVPASTSKYHGTSKYWYRGTTVPWYHGTGTVGTVGTSKYLLVLRYQYSDYAMML